jgi:poly(A) polymerase
LRVLRYYRFEARFGSGDGDSAARAACRVAAGSLPKLSAERVAQELMRLLTLANPLPALRMMAEDGVLAVLLPEAVAFDRLTRLIGIEPMPDPLRRLAALVAVEATGAVALAERLRLSNAGRERLCALAKPWPFEPADDDKAQRLAIYRLGNERYRDLALLTAAERGTDAPWLRDLLALAESWHAPAFPLAGGDVTVLGVTPGPDVGRWLGDVRRWWEDGDFSADRTACLTYLRQLVGSG